MNINKFFKFSYFSLITILLVTLFGFISVVPTQAKDYNVKEKNRREVCFCHNQNNNPQTICVSNFNDFFGHLKHVFQGKDSFGKCSITSPIEPPSVPEFGLIPGIIAGGASICSFLLLKKKSRK